MGRGIHAVVEFLTWPVVLVLEAVYGVICRAETPAMAACQKIARLGLLASVVVFTTLPLSLVDEPVIAFRPFLALGVAMLMVFVVGGKLSEIQAGDEDDCVRQVTALRQTTNLSLWLLNRKGGTWTRAPRCSDFLATVD